MDIGLFTPFSAFNSSPDLLRTLGREAEARGFESFWVPEHVVLFDEYESQYPYSPDGKFPGGGDTGLLDPLSALTFLAGVTERMRLGTAILLLPQRNPIYTAKMVADLDVLSGGRVDLGIGIGWLREEFEALNVPFAKRGARTDEYLQVLRTLWCDETSSFHGDLYDLPPCRMYPKPVQTPHPPVHVGGETDAALRRAAAHGQGWITYNRLPADMPDALARLDKALADQGRSRADFTLTVTPAFNTTTPDMVRAYRDAGVDRLVVFCLALSPDSVAATLDDLVHDVLDPARQ